MFLCHYYGQNTTLNNDKRSLKVVQLCMILTLREYIYRDVQNSVLLK